jgi:hypothetical protein
MYDMRILARDPDSLLLSGGVLELADILIPYVGFTAVGVFDVERREASREKPAPRMSDIFGCVTQYPVICSRHLKAARQAA